MYDYSLCFVGSVADSDSQAAASFLQYVENSEFSAYPGESFQHPYYIQMMSSSEIANLSLLAVNY
jgi:hypothetical protein